MTVVRQRKIESVEAKPLKGSRQDQSMKEVNKQPHGG